jgi:hypothetical protein
MGCEGSVSIAKNMLVAEPRSISPIFFKYLFRRMQANRTLPRLHAWQERHDSMKRPQSRTFWVDAFDANFRGNVSIEVYEDGVLKTQDSDSNGFAQVVY